MIKRLSSGLYNWLDDRVEISVIIDFCLRQLTKPVPRHLNWLFSFGTVTLMFFLSQAVTGILLMIYYEASADSAYESVRYIMEQVRFGWLMRQVHSYGANFMIAFLLLHSVRVFFYGGYKKPRELTWLFGFGLLAVTLAFGFTGYLLPWDQLSYWGTTVGTEIAAATPVIGEYLLILMRGGEIVSDVTLTRFFVLHVVILPWIFVALVAGHLILIRYKGISPLEGTDVPEKTPEELKQAGGKPFYPHHVMKEAIVVLLVLVSMIFMIIYYPLPLHEKADPFNTPIGVKPEWYFLSSYQALKYLPKTIGIIGSGLVVLAICLLPFWDRTPARKASRRPIATSLGIFFVVINIVLALLGKISETEMTIMGTRYHFDIYGWPHAIATVEDPAAEPDAGSEGNGSGGNGSEGDGSEGDE